MTASDLDERRLFVALYLNALDYLLFALRYSAREHGIENGLLLRHLWRRNATTSEPWVAWKLAHLLEEFEQPCSLELLTGKIGGVVAVSAWTVDAQQWMAHNLPDTPAFLFTPIEDSFIYRAPSSRVESRYVVTDWDVQGRQIVRVSGECSSIAVPEMAYEQIFEWPARDSLPQFDWAWLPGCAS
jgi:hypothetical protein